jgi:galactokinase
MADQVEADAPGRVNLIGEHTDYHQGYVLPTVIPQRTVIHLTRRPDRRIRASSSRLSTRWEEYEAGREMPGRGWLDYVQGVTAMLARSGTEVPGFDLRVESDIPVGAGVSSSAALTVSLLRGLRQLLRLDLDDLRLAAIAQSAETAFVGAPVGVMDPMASSLGRDNEALFIDTRSLATERLRLPSSIEVVVIDSGVSHAHAGGGYVTRRGESFEAAALLGVTYLRDVDDGSLDRLDALPPVLARRARHVITENRRVLVAVDSLRAGDGVRLGRLFAESHASLRDDYEVSTPDVDALVDIGQRQNGIYGARMTGGGFGGAVVLIAQAGRGGEAARLIQEEYSRQRGRQATVLVPNLARSI